MSWFKSLIAVLVLCVAPVATLADTTPSFLSFSNGEVTRDGFNWQRGGGDPLHQNLRADSYRAALAIERLNLDPVLQGAIRNAIATRTPERIDIRMYENNRLENAVMISGNGWVAYDPMVMTPEDWPVQRFGASSWFVTAVIDGEIVRVQVIIADACGNLIIIWRGGAVPCVCDTRQDACPVPD